MVDVGAKPKTERVARATARITLSADALAKIREGRVEKGDVLAAARLAGIMAAKRTPDLVPLCHPIALSGVEVGVRLTATGALIEATVRTVDRTGVEMEALTAASAGALTIYDMLKSTDKGMVIGPVQLEHKSGGRSGTYERGAPPAARRARRR